MQGVAMADLGAPADLYREIKTGGRWARRSVAVGDRVGQSIVVRDIGLVGKCRRFEITCQFCEVIQIRSAGQINAALRYERSITCPRCLSEGRLAKCLDIQDKRLERVLGGGPVYTLYEEDAICDGVLSDLEAEFGPSTHDDMPISEMTIAAGWPYSANVPAKDAVAEYIGETEAERAWRHEMNSILFAKRDLEYRTALRRAYERDQEKFTERAHEAAKALESFVQAGGQLSVTQPRDPCPCSSGLAFADCHGSDDQS
jgi:hypothetical protein